MYNGSLSSTSLIGLTDLALQQYTSIDIDIVIHRIMWRKLAQAKQHHLSLQHSGLHEKLVQLSLHDSLQSHEILF